MRNVNIIDFRNNMTKELESLPFRIVKRTKVLAVIMAEDKTDEVQSLNIELEKKQALIEKLEIENANLVRGKHFKGKPESESLNIEVKTDWGDLRERLGYPRPAGVEIDKSSGMDDRYKRPADLLEDGATPDKGGKQKRG